MIQKIMNDALKVLEQNNTEEVVVSDWWRSSGLGSCMRGRFLQRLLAGAVLPAYDNRTLGVFRMGHITEESVIELLRQSEDWILFTQGEMEDPQLNLRGHFDAVLININTHQIILGEVKSKNSRAFKYTLKDGAAIHYKMQAHSYMTMINKSGFKIQLSGNEPDILAYLEANVEFVYGDAKKSIENLILILKAQIRAIQYIKDNPNKMGILRLTDNYFHIQPYEKLKEANIIYISKDDYRIEEFPIMIDDSEVERLWRFEVDLLNKCWRDEVAPPANESGAWQTKYCKYCEAGLCEKLDDKDVVKDLFVLYRQKNS